MGFGFRRLEDIQPLLLNKLVDNSGINNRYYSG